MVGIRKYKFYEGKFFERDMTNKEVKQTSFIIIILTIEIKLFLFQW